MKKKVTKKRLLISPRRRHVTYNCAACGASDNYHARHHPNSWCWREPRVVETVPWTPQRMGAALRDARDERDRRRVERLKLAALHERQVLALAALPAEYVGRGKTFRGSLGYWLSEVCGLKKDERDEVYFLVESGRADLMGAVERVKTANLSV